MDQISPNIAISRPASKTTPETSAARDDARTLLGHPVSVRPTTVRLASWVGSQLFVWMAHEIIHCYTTEPPLLMLRHSVRNAAVLANVCTVLSAKLPN